MGNTIQRKWRLDIVMLALAGMLAGLFVSRALLSISMIGFLAATLAHKDFFWQVTHCFRNRWLAALTVLFFLPFVSGLWSSSQDEWLDVVRIKLPLLFFPLAFAGSWQLRRQQWKQIGALFLLLAVLGCGWSLLHYFSDASAVNEEYLQAKSIPTPLQNDHVRFSWLVALAATGCAWVALKTNTNKERVVLAGLSLFFTAYLHVLAARTGLFCLYFFLLCIAIHLFITTVQTKKATLFFAAFVLLPVAAWLTLPTFQNRLAYFLYDFSYIRSDTYLPGGNDGNRVLSIKAGIDMLRDHPYGVGAGEVRAQTNQWYASHVPGMLPEDRLLPSSEWLMYSAFAGWPGLLLFTAIMLLPLTLPVKNFRLPWILINSMAALSFLFDVGLEVQFGVFAYLFVVLCAWKFFRLLNSPSVGS